jgi:hypothetical protein
MGQGHQAQNRHQLCIAQHCPDRDGRASRWSMKIFDVSPGIRAYLSRWNPGPVDDLWDLAVIVHVKPHLGR